MCDVNFRYTRIETAWAKFVGKGGEEEGVFTAIEQKPAVTLH
jgi:hypothetical protein